MDNKPISLSLPLSELMPAIEEMLAEGQTVALTVNGVSMQPFLMDRRDTAYLSSAAGRRPRVGDIYMFRRSDGSYAMHRVCAVASDGTLDFIGDGQVTAEKGIDAGALAAYVPFVVRKGRRINCEKGLVRFIMTARMQRRVRFPHISRILSAPIHCLTSLMHNSRHTAGAGHREKTE